MPDTIPPSPMQFAPGTPVPEAAEPMPLLELWLAEARASEPNDPNAMTLATVSASGRPAARMVLLKGIEPRGLVFYSHAHSRKGQELAANGQAALLFHWKSLRRQVRVEGAVERVSDAEADAYFATRARQSRLGALASDQSRPLPGRQTLEQRVRDLDAQYPGEDIPRPAGWGGYRVVPDYFEFWQDMPYRLHDRRAYTREDTRDGAGWVQAALYP